MNNLKQVIHATVQKVVEEQSLEVAEIHEQDALVDDLGLRSLDLARLVAILEFELNVDPFAELVSITSVRTVGDLHAAYAKCFAADKQTEETTPEQEAQTLPPQAPRRRQRDLRRKARNDAS